MFRKICLMTWKAEVDDERLGAFLDWADEAFARASFPCSQGASLGGDRADWSYIVDFPTRSEIEDWHDHPLHREISERIGGSWAPEPRTPMFEQIVSISLDLGGSTPGRADPHASGGMSTGAARRP